MHNVQGLSQSCYMILFLHGTVKVTQERATNFVLRCFGTDPPVYCNVKRCEEVPEIGFCPIIILSASL